MQQSSFCGRWIMGGLLALPACTGTPHVDSAPSVASQQWTETSPQAIDSAQSATSIAALLGSSELADLLVRAQMRSPALLAATARSDQARALMRIARGAALPTLAIGATGSSTGRQSGSVFDFSGNFATIDAALSIDFAGGTSAARRSAVRRAEASDLDRRSLELSLAAELARTFVTRATLQARIGLIDRSIAQAAELQRIIDLRRREGVATQVDVGLQTIRLDQLRAERERLQQAQEETRVALALLVGDEAPLFNSIPIDIQRFSIPDVAIPPPSQIIVTRPDVRAAEARIEAAGGDVRVARAAFFPRLDLSVGRSTQSILGGGPLAGLSIGAELLAPIFNRNRLKGNLDYAAAQQREAVQNYRTILLNALGEIENGLSAANHARSRGVILRTVVTEAERTSSLARRQYLEGDADLRHLLDAQDLLINVQDVAVLSLQERLEAAIVLYRASSS